MATTLIGQTLLHQFRVDAFVASGGMGSVYRVWDLKRNVPLAMKVLHADLADDPSILKRFQREADALKKLTHPNIVPFYGMYQYKGQTFLLERFVDGPSLKDILSERGDRPLGIGETLVYLKALSAALGYAHTNGVIHCDVKPGNVMLDQGGNIYLTDFGVARHAESTTTTLATAGTVAYMAPEQIRGEPVSPATDVYAMGVMLFEMLTGRRPFRGDELRTLGAESSVNERIRAAHLGADPPDPRLFNPGIPQPLATVILKALEKNTNRRYPSLNAMLVAACAAANSSPARVPDRVIFASLPPGVLKPKLENIPAPGDSHFPSGTEVSSEARWISRKSVPVFLAGGVILALLFIFILSGGLSNPPNPGPYSSPPIVAVTLAPSGNTGSDPGSTSNLPFSTSTSLPLSPIDSGPPPTLPQVATAIQSPPPGADALPTHLPPSPTPTSAPAETEPPSNYPDPPAQTDFAIYHPLDNCEPSRLHVGDWAYVSFGGGENFIRRTPDTHPSDNILGSAPEGEPMEIIGGPQCSYGWMMWKVITAHGLKGWTAEAGRGEFWLMPGLIWRPCQGAPKSRLKIGDTAMVSLYPESVNNLRQRPNEGARKVGEISPGEQIRIVDGPACAGGFVWWKVRAIGKDLRGWTAEGDNAGYWLIPLPEED